MFQPEAKIIADSINEQGCRLTTFALTYHRYIHSEVMTYRMWSRNASSSRAIPAEKNIKQVENLNLYPVHWGANQKGMQAYEEVGEIIQELAADAWDDARNACVKAANRLIELGIHKQVANRLLEPFNTITTLVTATDFSNFFSQRCHPDAQPEIRILAENMQSSYNNSTPLKLFGGNWHLPFISEEEHWDTSLDLSTLKKISVGRCARVSYLQHDGTRNVEKDVALHDNLLVAQPPHLSPFEHVARSMVNNTMYANLQGWKSLRWQIEHN
ncbi:MAG: FAD-dependent thymidylate synthase [Cytophagales bacterium]|nr:FAD-dependent thymidylate synthase [Cytophagales bacterium]